MNHPQTIIVNPELEEFLLKIEHERQRLRNAVKALGLTPNDREITERAKATIAAAWTMAGHVVPADASGWASSKEQDERVARVFPGGEHPFWTTDIFDREMKLDLRRWVDSEVLIGLVSDPQGGIIGYIHQDHIDRVTALLNAAVSETLEKKE
jgi:hypothetical protein